MESHTLFPLPSPPSYIQLLQPDHKSSSFIFEFLLCMALSMENSVCIGAGTWPGFSDWAQASDNRIFLVLNARERSVGLPMFTAVAQGMLLISSEAFLFLSAPLFSFQASKTMPPIRIPRGLNACVCNCCNALTTLLCGSWWLMIKECKDISFLWLILSLKYSYS